MAGIRQIVETVYDKLFNIFGLHRERPHELSGLRARLAARMALHNFCIRLNAATRSSSSGFRRPAGMVISTHTKRLRETSATAEAASTDVQRESSAWTVCAKAAVARVRPKSAAQWSARQERPA